MSAARVAAVRRFNRFYTKQIGILGERLLQSPFSLAEMRVLYEIANRENVSAVELAEELRLDAGYLSRILRRFQKGGLVRRGKAGGGGRGDVPFPTAQGAAPVAT